MACSYSASRLAAPAPASPAPAETAPVTTCTSSSRVPKARLSTAALSAAASEAGEKSTGHRIVVIAVVILVSPIRDQVLQGLCHPSRWAYKTRGCVCRESSNGVRRAPLSLFDSNRPEGLGVHDGPGLVDADGPGGEGVGQAGQHRWGGPAGQLWLREDGAGGGDPGGGVVRGDVQGAAEQRGGARVAVRGGDAAGVDFPGEVELRGEGEPGDAFQDGRECQQRGSSNLPNSVSAKVRRASQTEVATVVACSGSVIVPIPRNLQPTTDSAFSVTTLAQGWTAASLGRMGCSSMTCHTPPATNQPHQLRTARQSKIAGHQLMGPGRLPDRGAGPELGQVRLDVQHRGAVDRVQTPHADRPGR